MVLKGHIYRGLKPVHWSPSSRTALAEAELEYPDGHTSPSVYAAFPAVDLPAALRDALKAEGLDLPTEEEALGKALQVAIWTTTPWTLPANLAVSVNERLDYALADAGEGRLLLVAADLIESLSSTLERPLSRRATVKGALLAGLTYSHPLLERTSPVVIGGEYITTESGTGLVHTAPGHGVDDFHTGQKNGLPVLCPVDEAGNLTDEAGPFAGLNVLKDANPKIIEALEPPGPCSNRRTTATVIPTTGAPRNPPSSGHGAMVRLRGWLPSAGPRCDRRSGVDPCLRSQPDRSDGEGTGRLVHLPSAHLGCADPRLLSPQQRRGAAERRHPGSHPGIDRRTRNRRLVGERRSRPAAGRLRRPGRAMAQRHRHHGCVVRLRIQLGRCRQCGTT